MLRLVLTCFLTFDVIKARRGGGRDVQVRHFIPGYDPDLSQDQLTILEGRFNNANNNGKLNGSYNFDSWNSWRHSDGFLCHTPSDCSWIDPNMTCYKQLFAFEINVRLPVDWINRER